MKTLVLGVGNLLLADEGVGVHAAQVLQQEDCPQGVEILDVGTAILDALPALEAAERIIVLDAMKGGGKPGSIYRVPLLVCRASPCIASLHGFDLLRVLAISGRANPPDALVLGVEPERIEWSMELSEQVSLALPFLVQCARTEMTETKWGEVAVRKVQRCESRGP